MKKLAAFVIALATGAGFLMTAPAQAAPTAGKEYKVLQSPQPVPAGKIEVTEFFWYGCPHCYDFENTWTAWVAKQGKDVVIKRVPVAFRDDLLPHTKIFYALESLGKLDALHGKVFDAIKNGEVFLRAFARHNRKAKIREHFHRCNDARLISIANRHEDGAFLRHLRAGTQLAFCKSHAKTFIEPDHFAG